MRLLPEFLCSALQHIWRVSELQRHLDQVNSWWNASTLRVSQNGTALSLPARQEHV